MKKIKILGNYYNYPTLKELKKVTFGDLGKLDNFTIPPYKDSTWGKVMFTLGDFNFYVTIDTVDIPSIDLNQKILDNKNYRINYFNRNMSFIKLESGIVNQSELFDDCEYNTTLKTNGKIDLELLLFNLKDDKYNELVNQLESMNCKEFDVKILKRVIDRDLYSNKESITLLIKDIKYFQKYNESDVYLIPIDKKVAMIDCQLLTGTDELLQKDKNLIDSIDKLDEKIASKVKDLLKLLNKKDTLIPKIVGKNAEYSESIMKFEDSFKDYYSSSLKSEVETFLEYMDNK